MQKGPAENPDKVLVVRRNGTVVAWSVPDTTELGRWPGPGPVFGMQRIPGGVITGPTTCSSGGPRAVGGRGLPPGTGAALRVRSGAGQPGTLGVSWNRDPWTMASTWRLDGHGDLLWRGLIGRPRELDPFLEPEYLEAPHKSDGYYIPLKRLPDDVHVGTSKIP